MDHRNHASRPDLSAKGCRVVAGVADQRPTARKVEKLKGRHHLVPLPWRQRDVERPPLRVDDRVDLGREPSSRASDRVLLDPPFPPDASWCARTTVPSTAENVSSTSTRNLRNTCAQTSF